MSVLPTLPLEIIAIIAEVDCETYRALCFAHCEFARHTLEYQEHYRKLFRVNKVYRFPEIMYQIKKVRVEEHYQASPNGERDGSSRMIVDYNNRVHEICKFEYVNNKLVSGGMLANSETKIAVIYSRDDIVVDNTTIHEINNAEDESRWKFLTITINDRNYTTGYMVKLHYKDRQLILTTIDSNVV